MAPVAKPAPKKAVEFSEGAEPEAEVGGLDICAMDIESPEFPFLIEREGRR